MLNIFRAKRAAAGLGDPTSPGRSGASAGRKSETVPPVDEEEEGEDEDEEEAEDEDLDEAEDGDDEENDASDGDEDEPEGDDEEEAPPAKKGKGNKSASDDRGRVRAIMTSPEGRANPGLAEALAFDTNLSSTKAIKLLQASKPSGKRQSLGAALAAEGADRPRVGMGGSRGEARSAEDEQIASIVKAAASAGMTRKSA